LISVSRAGKYHSLPSAFCTPAPENIWAKRLIGVSAPALFQPRGAPVGDDARAEMGLGAASAGGEVATFSA